MKIMKNDGRLRRIAGATLMAGLCAAALLVSCSQDELFSAGEDAAGDTLPEGMYPLEIGSISVSAEGSGQPWGAVEPQTRVGENSDGSGSVFTNGDAIGVSLDGNTAIYTYDGSTWTSDAPLYWKDTNKGTVTAWYPAEDEIVDFTQQDQGLPYLLKATTDNADYKTAASLTFTHQLAKVRVVLTGVNASKVADVKIRSYPNAPINQGTLSNSNGTPAYYPMRKATYGSTTCWEANMIPGTLIADNSFQISKSGGTPVNVTLAGNVPIKAGYMHTITIAVKSSVVPDNAKEITGDISDSGNYYVTGTRTSAINITGGSPKIYLVDATVSVSSGNAIKITGGSPTIHVVGENTLKNTRGNSSNWSNSGAGIYVASNNTVYIEGNSRTDDVLTVNGGAGGCGIGGYLTGSTTAQNCGNIVITNVTIKATGSYNNNNQYSPAIGAAGKGSCGTIMIDNATVYASGVCDAFGYTSTSAIGAGTSNGTNNGSYSTITIRNNSNVYASRGNSYSDYIGYSGSETKLATGATDATVENSIVTTSTLN